MSRHLLTPSEYTELQAIHARAFGLREHMERLAERACELLGVDAAGCSLSKDFAEEIVFHGTPPSEAIRNIRDYEEVTQ